MRSRLLPGERTVRRRGNLEQGRALETLGHAVEYLADSQMFEMDPDAARHTQEAIQLLMRCSRAVFVECPEVIPMRRRMGRWFATRAGRLTRQRA